MRDSSYRKFLYLILFVALVMRFGFLLSQRVLPVMWDARLYASAALGLISYVDTPPGGLSDNGEEGRAQFNAYLKKYINGEQIDWLMYKQPTLKEARDLIYLGGPLYPATLAVLFAITPLQDFTVARILGILMDLLSTLLIIGIAYRLIGRSAALVAGALYAVYFPFTLASTMLLLATSTTFYTLLAVYLLLRAVEDDHRRQYVLAGLVAGLLVLNKPTATLLFIPLAAGLFLYGWRQRPMPTLVNRVLLFLLPAMVFFVGWVSVTSIRYGQLTLSDPQYSSANLKSSSSVEFEGYDLDRVYDDFQKRSLAKELTGNPLGYLILLAKKFDRLWAEPYNDFRRSIFLPAGFFDRLHVVIVVFGLIGLLALLVVKPRAAAWGWLIVLYYTAIHLVFHSLSRYNFVAMPFVILGAAWFIWDVGRHFAGGESHPKYRIIFALVLLIAAWFFDQQWVNAAFGTGVTFNLVLLSLIGKVLLLAFAILMLTHFLQIQTSGGRWLVTLVAALILTIPLATSTFARDAWTEFSCRLDKPGIKAGTRIYISRPPVVAENEALVAVIDMNSAAGRENTFTVWLDHDSTDYVQGKEPLRSFFYPKPTYRFYSLLTPIPIEEYRQYATIPLDAPKTIAEIDSLGYFNIAVAINSRVKEENNYVTLYGSYPAHKNAGYIPSFRYTSVERFVERGDPRIPQWVNYSSDSAKSYYIPRDTEMGPEKRDLSPSPGYQFGRYHMYLVHLMPDGSFDVY